MMPCGSSWQGLRVERTDVKPSRLMRITFIALLANAVDGADLPLALELERCNQRLFGFQCCWLMQGYNDIGAALIE